MWGDDGNVADGRIYVGDEDGDVAILKAGRTRQLVAEPNMGAPVYSTPVAKDGVLYVLGRNALFALQVGTQGAPAAPRSEGSGGD